jgi:hypothetical protein
LAEAGIFLLTSRSVRLLAQEAEALTASDFVHRLVATKPGWVGPHFVLGDGTIISPAAAPVDLINLVEPNSNFAVKGDQEAWLDQVTPLIAGQEAALVALSFPFLGPVLSLLTGTDLEIQNPIVDVTGDSSIGKSTIFIRLAGSVWGWADRDTGFGESWLATKGGIEIFLPSYVDGWLGLDEANLAGSTEDERGKLIATAVHIIAHGRRKTTKPTGLAGAAARLACVSTGNDQLLDLIGGSRAARAALAARMPTITVPANRRHKILSNLPEGYANSEEVIDAIKALTARLYGCPIRVFLKGLVEDAYRNKRRLIKKIRRHADRFSQAARIAPSLGVASRRAKPIGLAYAVSQLAREYGALPRKNMVGNYLKAFVEIWRWTGERNLRPAQDGVAVLQEFIDSNKTAFTMLKRPRLISDAKFRSCPGYLRTTSRGRELVISASRAKREPWLSRTVIDDLISARVLVGESGKNPRMDTKRKVCLDKHGELIADRVWVFNLDRLKALMTARARSKREA